MGTIEKPPAGSLSLEVRHCHGLEEFQRCMELERLVWGLRDPHVPLPIYIVAAETGGQVLGAFDAGNMVGFTLAVPAFHKGRIYLHSHMTAVLPEYQDHHVGRKLKLFQRQDALEHGIELVEWTFDPLELKNAYFNIVRLGTIARRFLPNFYGVTSSPLHSGLPTDRLVAEWWLNSRRVQERLSGQRPPEGQVAMRIRLPANIGELKRNDPEAAAQIQKQIREEFQHWLGRGHVVTGFELSAETASYVLEPT